MEKENITTISLEQARKLKNSGKTSTQQDAPEYDIDPEFWKEAKPVFPEHNKEQLTMRFDKEVIDYFKNQGKGYQTRMNAVLKAYVDAHSHESTT